MMGLRVVINARPLRDSAGFRIRGAVVKPLDPRRRNCHGAHRARLQRDPQTVAGQALTAQRSAGRADCQDFSMRRWVVQFPCTVSGAGNHFATRIDQHGPNRNLPTCGRRARLFERLIHMAFERHPPLLPCAAAPAKGFPFRLSQARACSMSEKTPPGDRIAKVLARAGVASRREAERMIVAGRVTVNGKQIDSPALNVTATDKITVDGTQIGEPDPARIWLYHKPAGLVTTERDEKGRATVFDSLPDDLPRVMSIGRLDLNSEGLLLLTNDGGVKRRLELPSTGWLRRYRVRVKGKPADETFDPLRRGTSIDGEHFLPMQVTLDRQQGANAWLTVALREGKNREIRRAMTDVGLEVNRLIRVSYGPFQLGQLKAGEVEEVRQRVVRDQLGLNDKPKRTRQKPTGRKRR